MTKGFASACLLLAAWSSNARADAGALSLTASAGSSVVSVRPPYGSAAQEAGTSWALALAGAYAVTNRCEVRLQLFYEPPEQFVHSGATITNDAGTFQGSLLDRSQRIGALAGARRIFGLVWQLVIGVDAGWSHRTFSRLDLVDVSGGGSRSFGLQLPDASQDALLVAPVVGIRWSGDHFAFGIEPRVEALVGSATTWAVVAPLTISWSWYL